jgi:hypothetical protein
MRSQKTRSVVSLRNSHFEENTLAKIWYGSDKLKEFRQHILPVHTDACYYCTRHFYQNEYLNKLLQILQKSYHYGVPELLSKKDDDEKPCHIWL